MITLRKMLVLCTGLVITYIFVGCSKKEELTYMEQANLYYGEGKYVEAAEEYRQAIEEGEGVIAWRGLIECLSANDNADNVSELISAYESLRYTDDFTDEDYNALALLYQSTGDYINQRDLLEQYYRINSTEETKQTLNSIVCDCSKDSEVVANLTAQINEELAGGNWSVAAGLIVQPESFDVLFPKLNKGHRRYELKDGDSTTKFEVGYNDQGLRYIDCWYLSGSEIIVISYKGGAVLKCMEGTLSADSLQGVFSIWSFNGIDGSVFCDEGTFTNGICTGKIVTKVSLDNTLSVQELLESKDSLGMTSYVGDFNSDGTTAVRQDEENTQNIIYAYSEDEKNVLYVEQSGKDASTYVFSYNIFGLPDIPVWSMIEE